LCLAEMHPAYDCTILAPTPIQRSQWAKQNKQRLARWQSALQRYIIE
jgi:hypothetical protein